MWFRSYDLQKHFQYALALTGEVGTAYDVLEKAMNRWSQLGTPRVDHNLQLRKLIRGLCFEDLATEEAPAHQGRVIELLGKKDLRWKNLSLEGLDVPKLLEELSCSERELLFLSIVEEKPLKEVAEFLDLPLGALLVRLHALLESVEKIREDQSGGRRHGASS